MVMIKWNNKLKDKFGWHGTKDLYVKDEKCLERTCFRAHDWRHDGHLVCITNANNGCPDRWEDM